MRLNSTVLVSLRNILICALFVRSAVSSVIISEVADRGTSNSCPYKQDWVELQNTGPTDVSLAGFKLHDDNGPSDSTAYVFPSDAKIKSGEFLVLCTRVDAKSPQFKIGGEDKITLRNASGVVMSTSDTLQNEGEYNSTWAYNSKTSAFAYTTTPTPGRANVFTYKWPSVRAQLAKQHDDGEAFFESNTIDAVKRMPPVVELRVTMSAKDWAYQLENASYEVYKPFTELKVTTNNGAKTHTKLSAGGRARPRGQSTMAIPVCLGSKTVPWLFEVATGANKSQRLFGMEKFYLRMHLGDPSYLREWAMHRMLRRFGLPYLRTRTVKLYINGDYRGMYELLEAPDQDYMFYRNFGVDNTNAASTKPPFAPGHALYKVKTQSLFCGEKNYEGVFTYLGLDYKSLVAKAEKSTEPKRYAFDRGEHRVKIPVHEGDGAKCGAAFWAMMGREFTDILSAWVHSGKDCGKFAIKNGRVDRDLGGSDKKTNNNDGRMKDFFNTYLADAAWNTCGKECDSDSGIYASLRNTPKVDVDQWLKNFAAYAVTLGQDSVLNNGNNYLLATPGGSTEAERAYRIVQYDHNNMATADGSELCVAECRSADVAVYWSIARPTCRALKDNRHVGPLLAGPGNKANMQKYLAYVKQFNEKTLANPDFIAILEAHAKAIAPDMKEDPGAAVAGIVGFVGDDGGTSAKKPAESWKSYDFIPFLKKRGEEVKKQIAAIDAGTFPRFDDKVPATEPCQDWRRKTSPTTEAPPKPHISAIFKLDVEKCTELMAGCKMVAHCFDESGEFCDETSGKFTDAEKCPDKIIGCRNCFPNSVCGSKRSTTTTKVASGVSQRGVARVMVIMTLLITALVGYLY